VLMIMTMSRIDMRHPKGPLDISWEPAQSRSHHHELDLVQVSDRDT
jgi:hypothetical protein